MVTLCACVLTSVYFYVNGQEIRSSHTDFDVTISTLQMLIASIIAVVFSAIKRTRKWYWFTIPLMLVIFLAVYGRILSQYVCCPGG